MGVIEEVSRYDDHVNQARMRRQKHFADRAERAIRRLQAAGEADPEVDPEIAALALGSMVARVAELWLIDNWGDYDLDKVADQVTKLWANRSASSRSAEGAGLAGQAEAALRDRVALDLVGAAADAEAGREEAAVQPRLGNWVPHHERRPADDSAAASADSSFAYRARVGHRARCDPRLDEVEQALPGVATPSDARGLGARPSPARKRLAAPAGRSRPVERQAGSRPGRLDQLAGARERHDRSTAVGTAERDVRRDVTGDGVHVDLGADRPAPRRRGRRGRRADRAVDAGRAGPCRGRLEPDPPTSYETGRSLAAAGAASPWRTGAGAGRRAVTEARDPLDRIPYEPTGARR